MGAAGLCYPRRPRATGALFILAGVSVWAVVGARYPNVWIVAVSSLVLGVSTLLKFRNRDSLAPHRASWIGR